MYVVILFYYYLFLYCMSFWCMNSVYNRVFNTCSLLLISMKSREIQSSTRALPINLSFCTYLLDYKRNGFIFYMYRVRSHTHNNTYHLKKKEEEKGSQHLTNNTPYFISLRLNFTPSKKKIEAKEEKIYNY